MRGNFRIVEGVFGIVEGVFGVVDGNFPVIGGVFSVIRGIFPLIRGNFPLIHGIFPVIRGNFRVWNGSFVLLGGKSREWSGQFRLVLWVKPSGRRRCRCPQIQRRLIQNGPKNRFFHCLRIAAQFCFASFFLAGRRRRHRKRIQLRMVQKGGQNRALLHPRGTRLPLFRGNFVDGWIWRESWIWRERWRVVEGLVDLEGVFIGGSFGERSPDFWIQKGGNVLLQTRQIDLQREMMPGKLPSRSHGSRGDRRGLGRLPAGNRVHVHRFHGDRLVQQGVFPAGNALHVRQFGGIFASRQFLPAGKRSPRIHFIPAVVGFIDSPDGFDAFLLFHVYFLLFDGRYILGKKRGISLRLFGHGGILEGFAVMGIPADKGEGLAVLFF